MNGSRQRRIGAEARRANRRRVAPRVEPLEARDLKTAISVDVGSVVRPVSAEVLGVSVPGYDYNLSADSQTGKGVTPDPKTVGLIRDAGLKVLRLSNGSGADEFHFASDQNAFPIGAGLWANLAASAGADALVNVNYGTGTPQEAAAYLAYLNGSTDNMTRIGVDAKGTDWGTASSWASLRGQDPIGGDRLDALRAGHAEPYGFSRFEVGNEVYFGGWDGAPRLNASADFAALATKYASFVKTFADLAAQIDPSVSIGVDVANPGEYDALWNIPLLEDLKALGYTPGFLSDHFYVYDGTNETPLSDQNLLEHSVSDPSSVMPIHANSPRNFQGRAAAFKALLSAQLGPEVAESVRLVCAEFNADSQSSTKQGPNLVRGLFMADAIGSALESDYAAVVAWDFRNAYESRLDNPNFYGWRSGSDEGMVGTYANGVSAPETGPYVPYPAYFAEQIASKIVHDGDTVVAAVSDSPEVSVYAIRQANGHLGLLVINKSATSAASETFHIAGFVPSNSATMYRYGILEDDAQRDSADGMSNLTTTSPTLDVSADGSFDASFPAYSMTVLDLSPADGAMPMPMPAPTPSPTPTPTPSPDPSPSTAPTSPSPSGGAPTTPTPTAPSKRGHHKTPKHIAHPHHPAKAYVPSAHAPHPKWPLKHAKGRK